MGLVIQAPIDALLAAPAPAAAAAPAPAGAEGLFATLFASLAAAVEGEAPDFGLDPAILPDTATDAEEETGRDDLLAALLSVSMPLVGVTAAATGESTEGASIVSAPAPSAAQTAPAGMPEASPAPVEHPTAALSGATPGTSGAAIAGAPPAEAQQNIAPDAAFAVAPGPGDAAVPPVPANSGAPIGTAPAAPPEAAAPTEAAPPSGAPAASPQDAKGEAPPAAAGAGAETTSVVRNVGNAEPQNRDHGHGPARREAERPSPRASAQGIAHAAPNSAVGALREAPQSGPVDVPAAPDVPQQPATGLRAQVDQVATTVIETVEAGGGEARIHLDPADLGEVVIHVHTDGDTVTVDVRAERQEAAQLLRDHTRDLSGLLGERGLNLADVNVGLGRGDAGQAWGQERRDETRVQPGQFAAIFGGDEPAAVETHNRLRAAYNPDGAHLYRV